MAVGQTGVIGHRALCHVAKVVNYDSVAVPIPSHNMAEGTARASGKISAIVWMHYIAQVCR